MNLALIPILAMAISASNQSTPAQRVEAFLKDAREDMRFPAIAFAVVKNGKVVQQGAVGESNLTYHVKAETDTPFLIASVTKQFTSAAIMKLVEEGKVKLDSSVTEYVPDSPEAWKPVTIRQLLTHTAGFKHRFEDADMSQWKMNYTKEAMLKSAKSTALDAKPGEKWLYSDQGYFLLGIVIENVTGKSYRQYLTETFFKPLGMNASTTIALSEIVPKMAQGYAFVNEKWWNNNRRTDYGMTSHFGVISTVGDLAKWSIALDGGKVVKPESLATMWTPCSLATGTTPTALNSTYGFGWFLDRFNGHRIVEHGGSTGTELYKLPDDKLTVVVLTNLEQVTGGDAGFLARQIAKIYCPAISWGSLKAVKATDAAMDTRLKEEIKRVLNGEMDANNFDETYAKAIKPALAAQKAWLKSLGEPKSVDLVRQDAVGGQKAYGYKVDFKSKPFYITIRLNEAGKIIGFVMEPEDLGE